MLFCETKFTFWQRRKCKRYYILVCYVFYPENLIIILEYKWWCSWIYIYIYIYNTITNYCQVNRKNQRELMNNKIHDDTITIKLYNNSVSKDSHRPEPSHTIRIANKLTGFYMIQTLTERCCQTNSNND